MTGRVDDVVTALDIGQAAQVCHGQFQSCLPSYQSTDDQEEEDELEHRRWLPAWLPAGCHFCVLR